MAPVKKEQGFLVKILKKVFSVLLPFSTYSLKMKFFPVQATVFF